MTISLEIRWDEGPLTVGAGSGSGQIRYVAKSDDPANDGRDEVLNKLANDVPDTLFGLILDQISVEERLSDTATEAHWDCVAEYINSTRKQPFPLSTPVTGQPRPWRLTIKSANGGAITQTQSREYIGEAVLNQAFGFGTVTDLQKYIGFEANSETRKTVNFGINGVSRSLYGIELSVETVATAAEVSGGFLVTIAGYAGQNVLNKLAFAGYAPRTLKFTNFQSAQRAGKDGEAPETNTETWDLNYTFSFAPYEDIEWNGLTPIDDPDNPGNPRQKRGHEYVDTLWVERKKEVPNVPGLSFNLPVVTRIAIHRLENEVDFKNDLGLGALMP